MRRGGPGALLDVAAFRTYYRLAHAHRDTRWREERLLQLQHRYPPPQVDRLHTASPNSADAEQFIKEHQPDITIALCKNILAKRIFSIPPLGTFVLHPGICPEYRNAHGCFWALVRRDLANVGLTLLRIDQGIDTGPIFGYFRSPYDERRESHRVIQDRMLLDNLDRIRDAFLRVADGAAHPLSTAGRDSAVWGQPRLTSYVRWKHAARSFSTDRASIPS